MIDTIERLRPKSELFADTAMVDSACELKWDSSKVMLQNVSLSVNTSCGHSLTKFVKVPLITNLSLTLNPGYVATLPRPG